MWLSPDFCTLPLGLRRQLRRGALLAVCDVYMMYVYVCVCVCVCVYMMYVYMFVCVSYTYIYTYTHILI